MQRPVRFHPAALQDAEEAAAWYAERSVRAAVRFLDELHRLIDLIALSPDGWRAFDYLPTAYIPRPRIRQEGIQQR